MTPYYERLGVTIYHGKAQDFVAAFKREHDHLITDPPYAPETHDGARTLVGRRGGTGPGGRGFGSANKAGRLVDFEPMTVEELRALLAMYRPKRWAVFTCDYQHIPELEAGASRIGYRWVRFGIWAKVDGAPQLTGDRPAQGWEAVAIMYGMPTGRMRWNGGGAPAVWFTKVQRGLHPTQKPIALVGRWVEQFTDKGDLILDPFMGSGTTLVAAAQQGRRAIGIEMEERYCETAAKRIERLTLPLFADAPSSPSAYTPLPAWAAEEVPG